MQPQGLQGSDAAAPGRTSPVPSGARLYMALCIASVLALPALGLGEVTVVILVALTVPLWLHLPKSAPLAVGDKLVCSAYVLCVFVGVTGGTGNPNIFSESVTLCILVPILFATGRRAMSADIVHAATAAVLVVVALAAALAVAETARRSYLVVNDSFFVTPDRGGQFRARGLFPQSLVLALACSVAIGLTLIGRPVKHFLVRTALVCVFSAGIWASGSRAAFFVTLAITLAWVFLRLLQRARVGRFFFALLAIGTTASAVVLLGGFLSGGRNPRHLS
jgi:hypothetical protein